jgi:hypothetical protein
VIDDDAVVAAGLGRLVPLPVDVEPAWEDALGRARRRSRTRRLPLVVAAVVAALSAVALGAFDVLDRGSPSVVERALAAVGDRPVLHVVFRGAAPVDAVINRKTGIERNGVWPESSFWYDPDRGLHVVTRIGDVVLQDTYSPTGKVEEFDQLALLARNYTEALASGRASVAGEGDVDGAPVFWIRVTETTTHGVTNGQRREYTLAREVAVSQTGYRPVATRTTIDGRPDGRPIQRIAAFETLAAGNGDFSAPPAPPQPNLGVLCCSTHETTLAAEASLIGQRPLWLGDTFAGLPLRRVARLDAQTKKPDASEFTGTISALELFYGSLDEHGQPDLQQPHARVIEGKPLSVFLTHFATAPEGWAFINGAMASTTQDGVAVEIQTSITNADGASARAALAALTAAPQPPA